MSENQFVLNLSDEQMDIINAFPVSSEEDKFKLIGNLQNIHPLDETDSKIFNSLPEYLKDACKEQIRISPKGILYRRPDGINYYDDITNKLDILKKISSKEAVDHILSSNSTYYDFCNAYQSEIENYTDNQCKLFLKNNYPNGIDIYINSYDEKIPDDFIKNILSDTGDPWDYLDEAMYYMYDDYLNESIYPEILSEMAESDELSLVHELLDGEDLDDIFENAVSSWQVNYPYDDLLAKSVQIDIFKQANEHENDCVLDKHGRFPKDSYLQWLAKVQGVSIDVIEKAIVKINGEPKTFAETVAAEVNEYNGYTYDLVFCVEATVKDLVNFKDKGTPLKIPAGTLTGFYDRVTGAGTPFGIEFTKPIKIDPDDKSVIILLDNTLRWPIKKSCGMSDSAWKPHKLTIKDKTISEPVR